MHGTKVKNRKKRTNATSKDPLTLEHSRRHGKAVKKGMRKAKELKHAVLKAASVSKGKSKVEVVQEFLDVKKLKRKKKKSNECREGAVSPSLVPPRERS